MTSIYPASAGLPFTQLCDRLLTSPLPLLLPSKPKDAALSDHIASLYLHPALEALLHILNHDLPSAHFLVRKMQSAPAHEAMYIHGILHRIEGDFNNARAWYADVAGSEPFELVWGPIMQREQEEAKQEETQKTPPQKTARMFLREVERLSRHGEGDRDNLAGESRREIETLLRWCIQRFGTEQYVDASKVWVQPRSDIAQKGQDMVTGDQGFRKF